MPGLNLGISDDAIDEQGRAAGVSPLFAHERPGDFDHCPMFSHEYPEEDSIPTTDTNVHGQLPDGKNEDENVEDIDYNDPRLEPFPSKNAKSILAALRQIETSTDEDHTVVEGVPPSPIVSAKSSSPGMPGRDASTTQPNVRSDSMDSIHLGQASRVSLNAIAESSEESNEDSPNIETTDAGETGRATVVSQAGPMDPIVTLEAPSSEDEGIAMISTPSKSSEDGALRKRNLKNGDERPPSRNSLQSIQGPHENGGWVQAFFRILFVDWIGGFLTKFFWGNRRKA